MCSHDDERYHHRLKQQGRASNHGPKPLKPCTKIILSSLLAAYLRYFLLAMESWIYKISVEAREKEPMTTSALLLLEEKNILLDDTILILCPPSSWARSNPH
jgi:hypothetical protein